MRAISFIGMLLTFTLVVATTTGCAGGSSNLNPVWISENTDGPPVTVAVVVLPEVEDDIDDGERWAATLARAMHKELEPHFERTHAVNPRDDRLNNPPEGYRVLVIESHIVELDRGSETRRWLLGLGSGSTRVGIVASARYVGDEDPFVMWSDQTGSGMRASLGGSNSLLAADMRRLAKRGSTFIIEDSASLPD